MPESFEPRVIAKAVFVVTTASKTRAAGMTAAWVTRVSGSPALMAVAIHRGSRTGDLIEETGWYVINALGSDQALLAKRFGRASSRAGDRFAGLHLARSTRGCPILAGGVGYVECRVTELLPIGDHRLFVGEIAGGGVLRAGAPLLYTAALEEENGG